MFIAASAPSFKGKDRMLIEWYRRQMKLMNIDIKFNYEVKDISILDNFDEVIVATGATARKLRVNGAENCIDAVDYLNGAKVGDNVVVIGGGLSGCEIAYDLFLKGKKPVIIETRNDLMIANNLSLANTSYLRDFFKTNKVPVYLESGCTEIGKGYVTVKTKTGEEKQVKADNVIVSIGYNPAPIAKEGKRVHIIGDAYSVGNLRTVIWRAWDIATKI